MCIWRGATVYIHYCVQMPIEASDHREEELQAVVSQHVMLGIKFRSSEGAQSMYHHGAISQGQLQNFKQAKTAQSVVMDQCAKGSAHKEEDLSSISSTILKHQAW